jgi:hypothetical protein
MWQGGLVRRQQGHEGRSSARPQKVVGVMVVRNAAHLLGPVITFHRQMAGLDELLVVDNGSSDRTRQVLASVAAGDPGVRWREDSGSFRHGEILTDLARQAAADGATWVVPIDADEFWWTKVGPLRNVLVATPPEIGAWICPVVQFAQRRWVRHSHPAVLLTMTHVAQPHGRFDTAEDLVEAGEIGFVEMAYPEKVIVRASASVQFHDGSHSVAGFEGVGRPSTDIELLHAPLPSREALIARADHGRRVAAVRPDLRSGWHVRRWARLAGEGRLGSEWSANATRRGNLSLPNGRRHLARDFRLRQAAMVGITRRDRVLGPLRSMVGWPSATR